VRFQWRADALLPTQLHGQTIWDFYSFDQVVHLVKRHASHPGEQAGQLHRTDYFAIATPNLIARERAGRLEDLFGPLYASRCGSLLAQGCASARKAGKEPVTAAPGLRIFRFVRERKRKKVSARAHSSPRAFHSRVMQRFLQLGGPCPVLPEPRGNAHLVPVPSRRKPPRVRYWPL